MAKKQEVVKTNDRWEIRKGRTVWLSSPLKNCGYSEETMESLRKRGFRLYCNGKPVN